MRPIDSGAPFAAFQTAHFSFSPFPFTVILTVWNCPSPKSVKPSNPPSPRTSAAAMPPRSPRCRQQRRPGPSCAPANRWSSPDSPSRKPPLPNFRPLLKIERLARDGQSLKTGDVLLRLSGPARAILSAERVALNFVQRLSGIATLTAQFVDAVKGTRAQILDTRKTTPGWRRFEKYAVLAAAGKITASACPTWC